MADYAELKRKLGERRGYDGDDTRLGSFINDALAEIYGLRPDWSWAVAEHQFLLRPPDTGTIITPAGWTNGSNLVTGLSAATWSRTGAWLSQPDGSVAQVIAGASNGTDVYTKTKWPGSTSGATGDTYGVYYLDYPMPAGSRGVQEVVLTGGDGRTYPIRQVPLCPMQMAVRTQRDYESLPLSYSVVTSSRLPTPRSAATSLSASAGSSSLATGTYTYWWCWRNTATGELGPLSPSDTLAVTAGDEVVVTLPTKWDLGRRLFRSLVGESEPYFLADIASSGTYTDERGDDDLGFDKVTQEEFGRHTEVSGQYLIRFWPPPDDEYTATVQYYRAWQKLVEDNDAPLVPVEWHNAILELAESFALREEEQHQASRTVRMQAMAMVAKMEEAEDVNQGDMGAMGGRLSRRDTQVQTTLGQGAWPRHLDQ